jgi:hypothetical protein
MSVNEDSQAFLLYVIGLAISILKKRCFFVFVNSVINIVFSSGYKHDLWMTESPHDRAFFVRGMLISLPSNND